MVVNVRVSTANLRTYVRITGVDKQDTLFVMREIQNLWETNVSRFFNRHNTSYPFRTQYTATRRKTIPIKDAFSCSLENGVIIGSIDTADAEYIRYLVHGVPSGKGAYIPVIGARSKKGYYFGVPSIYWKVWEAFFKAEVTLIVAQFAMTGSAKGRRHVDINKLRAAAVRSVRNQIRSMQGGMV